MSEGVVMGPGLVVRRAILRLVAAVRERRILLGGRSREAHRGLDAGWLDAAAGCEYLDDRIRLTE